MINCMRKVRDSNPRYPEGYNRFRVCPVRPLWQLSMLSKAVQRYNFLLPQQPVCSTTISFHSLYAFNALINKLFSSGVPTVMRKQPSHSTTVFLLRTIILFSIK